MKQNTDEVLKERQRVLEESFLMDRDRQLLEMLRKQLSSPDRKKALAAASGISDEKVLDHLIEANIGSETIAALGIIPLVAVAWADGEPDEREKQAVLSACECEGITPDSISYALLQSWLVDEPDAMLFNAWKDFIAAASKSLSPIALQALKDDVLGRARKVAHASGGILGIGSISSDEEERLRDMELAFPS